VPLICKSQLKEVLLACRLGVYPRILIVNALNVLELVRGCHLGNEDDDRLRNRSQLKLFGSC
jgi:hypothetical protein